MIRRMLIALFLTMLSHPAGAQQIPLGAISHYLNDIRTAQASFVQTNADGSRSKGTVYIRRPGRMRFEYAKPDDNLVIAGGGQVAIFDPRSNAPPQQFPLSRTPLNLILAARVDLGRARMVTGYGLDPRTGATIVAAQDPEHTDAGTIALAFTPNPVALRSWVITDGGGARTEVVLGPLQTGKDFPASYFSIPNEAARRRGD